jgi:hypothetical protein
MLRHVIGGIGLQRRIKGGMEGYMLEIGMLMMKFLLGPCGMGRMSFGRFSRFPIYVDF